jgi:type I restriction enzyme S subunit
VKAGWNLREIGEAFQTVTGNTPPKSAKHYYGNAVPLVKPPELTDGDVGAASDGLSDSGAQVARVAPEGSVLVSCIGNLGKIGLATRPVAFNQQINAIYPDPTLALPKFTFYQVMSPQFRKQLDSLAAGTTVSIVNKSRFNSIKVPLPPLEEQQRIVTVLDEAFEGLARARAHAEANLQNARELFDETEAKLFRDISKGSIETTLGELASFRNGLNYSRTSRGDEVKVVGVGDFQDNFAIPTDTLSFTKIDGQLGDDDKLYAGDILAVRSNGNRDLIGRTMLMSESDEPTSFSGFTIRIRLNGEDVLPEYVCSYLRTKTAREKLTAGGGGANISNLNQRILSSFPISYPDKDGQRKTLDRLERLRENSKHLREDYAAKLHDIDDLRQSLLQKAFAGELT